MNYGEVLTKAWKIIWKFKVLWIFGIFASLGGGGGGGGGGGSSTRNPNSNGSQGGNRIFGFDTDRFSDLRPGAENFVRSIEQVPVWVWVAIVVGLIFLVLLITFISTIGRIGLIRGAWNADEGASHLSFGALFQESLPYFWRVFFFNLLVGLAIFAVILIMILPVIGLGMITMGIGALLILPLLCILIPLAWAVGLVMQQANTAIVGENLGMFEGLKRGWEIIKKNLGASIVMAIILYIGGGVASFIIGLPVLIIILPAIGAIFMPTQSLIYTGLGITAALLCIYIPIALALSGIVTSYTQTAWTLTFRRLTGRESQPENVIDASSYSPVV